MNTLRIGASGIDAHLALPWSSDSVWITSPQFPFGDTSASENQHFLFRILFDSTPAVTQAQLLITADDLYMVWLDGDLVGTGPVALPNNCHPYNAYDLTHWFSGATPGRHCLSVRVYYHGPRQRAHNSGDGRCAFRAQLTLVNANGGRVIHGTDQRWKSIPCLDRSSAGRMYGYHTQHAEDIDMRMGYSGWRTITFDDSHWHPAALVPSSLASAWHLEPQIALPVVWRVRDPKLLREVASGHWFVDMGEEMVGHTCLRVRGPRGHKIEVRHAEECESLQHPRFQMRCGCTYQEWVTLSGEEDLVEFFDYKGFRYLELIGWPESDLTDHLWVLERHTPWPAQVTVFSSADSDLNAIWNLCVNTIRVGTQERFLDCPTREKIEFLGDSAVTGLAHLILTADKRPYAQLFRDFRCNADTDLLLSCHGGLPYAQIIVEYSMLIPQMLMDYLLYSGDSITVKDWLPIIGKILAAYQKYANSAGLLTDLHLPKLGHSPAWPLVDWPSNFRDDYDDHTLLGSNDSESISGNVNTAANCFYYHALSGIAKLYTLLGLPEVGAHWKSQATLLKASIRTLTLDHTSHLFRDRVGSTHFAMHASVAALYTGIADSTEHDAIIALIRQKGLKCGVWFAHFVLRSLYRLGHDELAYALLTNDTEYGWKQMLRSGATTCLETWHPDQKWNTSFCHPWACAPIPLLIEELMGLQPTAPGWAQFRLRPKIPRSLAHASAKLFTPQGCIETAFTRNGPILDYHIHLPTETIIQLHFPPNAQNPKLNGTPITTPTSQPSQPQSLPQGEHHITWDDSCLKQSMELP